MADAPPELLLSPNPLWHYYWVSWGLVLFSILLVQLPVAYFTLVRPFDKKFEIKYYTLEKGIFYVSFLMRLFNYVAGILVQPYKDKPLKGLAQRFVNGRLGYQERVYKKTVNFRAHASGFQISLCYIMLISTVILFVGVIPLLIHDFILYPDFAAARNN
ncbi:hypothetical protein HCH_03610 [Hahella chejuensis KCTC 2396]|uniref:Uncharacterized protein n=1 Tax=Hahella chejuensis (strain KCTC 2396) TaxID=349521 RepID=Q2SG74_HAHCH|nr:hypothetical protein [Hahella chejuensis]ABC30350.1 hypothetical protein HCH_03610 [Hahella chejuensis KCTC 2396]